MIRRGEIWWADLGAPRGSAPALERPVVVVQSDALNASRIGTIVVASMTTNLDRALAAGNLLCPSRWTGLPHDSVVLVSQLSTLDRAELRDRVGSLPAKLMRELDAGLRLALEL